MTTGGVTGGFVGEQRLSVTVLLAAGAFVVLVWLAVPRLAGGSGSAGGPASAGAFGGGGYPVRPMQYVPATLVRGRLVRVRCPGESGRVDYCWIAEPAARRTGASGRHS